MEQHLESSWLEQSTQDYQYQDIMDEHHVDQQKLNLLHNCNERDHQYCNICYTTLLYYDYTYYYCGTPNTYMFYTWGDGSGLCYSNMCCSVMSDYSDCCITSIPTDPPVVIPIYPDISPPTDDSQGPFYPDVTPGIDIRVPDTDNKPPKPTNSNSNSNNVNQSPPKPPPKPPKSIGKIAGFGAFGFGATAMGGMYAKKKNDDRIKSEQEQEQVQQ